MPYPSPEYCHGLLKSLRKAFEEGKRKSRSEDVPEKSTHKTLTTRGLRGGGDARPADSFVLAVGDPQKAQVIIGDAVAAAHGQEDAGALLGALGCRGVWSRKLRASYLRCRCSLSRLASRAL